MGVKTGVDKRPWEIYFSYDPEHHVGRTWYKETATEWKRLQFGPKAKVRLRPGFKPLQKGSDSDSG